MKRSIFLLVIVLCFCKEEEQPKTTKPVRSNVSLHSANRPVPKSENWWIGLHNEDKSLLLENDYEFLFLGNSITFNWETIGKEVWEERYTGKSLNMGIGSDRTQHLLWRIIDADFTFVNPQLAIVLIGTNNTNGNVNTANEIADGVIASIKKLQEKLPETKILILGIFPRGEASSTQRTKVRQTNELISEIADNENVFYKDYGSLFLNEDQSIDSELISDTVHPNLQGYVMLADTLDRTIIKILN